MRKGKPYKASVCRQCHRERELIRYHKAPAVFRDWALRTNYGIDTEQYNQMLIEQNHRCKICNRHKSEFKHALAVDHCHVTGKVRGILCPNCNTGVGKFKDDSSLLAKAYLYIQEHE